MFFILFLPPFFTFLLLSFRPISQFLRISPTTSFLYLPPFFFTLLESFFSKNFQCFILSSLLSCSLSLLYYTPSFFTPFYTPFFIPLQKISLLLLFASIQFIQYFSYFLYFFSPSCLGYRRVTPFLAPFSIALPTNCGAYAFCFRVLFCAYYVPMCFSECKSSRERKLIIVAMPFRKKVKEKTLKKYNTKTETNGVIEIV